MSVNDLRCDICGLALVGPAGARGGSGREAVRFLYHPGDFRLKDDSGLLCAGCWSDVSAHLGERLTDRCCVCAQPVTYSRCIHWHRAGDPQAWFLCAAHGAQLLNRLRTVVPKLDPDAVLLSGDWRSI